MRDICRVFPPWLGASRYGTALVSKGLANTAFWKFLKPCSLPQDQQAKIPPPKIHLPGDSAAVTQRLIPKRWVGHVYNLWVPVTFSLTIPKKVTFAQRRIARLYWFPISRVIAPVTHLFSAIYKGPMSLHNSNQTPEPSIPSESFRQFREKFLGLN